MFTFDQIRSFVAVAEELHFGRAAKQLNITQPSTSRQIQKLEKSIGVELFERDNRKVALTAAGAAFLDDARRLLASASSAPYNARRVAAGRAGLLRIGFTAASGFSVLGPLLAELERGMPDVDVDLREMVTREQLKALADGELDLGLTRPPFDTRQFDSHLMLSESLLLAVPEGHPLSELERPVEVSDLVDVPLVMHHPTKARYFYDLAGRLIPVEHRNEIHSVSQILSVIALVAAKRGVAIVPESAQLLGINGVAYLRMAGASTDVVELHAIWAHDARNPALARLLQVLRLSAGQRRKS